MRIRQISAAALTVACSVMTAHALAQVLTVAETLPPRMLVSTVTFNQALGAARNNLEVALARSTAVAAQADVQAADRSPFPVLSAKLSSIDLQHGIGAGNLVRDKVIDKGLGIDWTWERGNKRELRSEAARGIARASAFDFDDIQLQQLVAASGAFFDLTAAQERVAQVEAMAIGTAQIAKLAARRVAAGDLARQDALRLEIEAERGKGEVLAAELERQRAALALASLMGVGSFAQNLQAQATWPVPVMTLAGTTLTDVDLQAWTAARPDLQAAVARLTAAQSLLEGAAAQKKADVTWGVSLDHFPGTSTRLLELRMQMPLQLGYQFQGETGRAQAQYNAAQDALDKVRRGAGLELQGLWAQLQSAARRSQSYDQDILPRALEVAGQAELAYTKGALALNDLLDARRTLRVTGLDALAVRADHAKAASAWRLRTQPAAAMLIE